MYMYLLYSLCYAQIMSCLICFTMKYNFLGVKIFSSFFPDTSEAIIPQHRYRGMLGQVALVVKWIERPLQMLYGLNPTPSLKIPLFTQIPRCSAHL